jgi:tripartite-type tricarboxylate transporter receptor subunit TctC
MGFPAGSGVDVVARCCRSRWRKSLGGKLVMDYRTGAGGNLASEAVARARPDGYTILLGTAATHGVNAALYRKLPFDVEADFTPIAPLSTSRTCSPSIRTSSTRARLKEFIEKGEGNPGKYNYASTGNGTGTHLAFAELVSRAGLNMVPRALQGRPGSARSVVAGQTCCIMNQVQTVQAQWKAGRVRLLGVTTATRVPGDPRDPDDRRGWAFPATRASRGSACSDPKGLDEAVVNRINAAVKAALETPCDPRAPRSARQHASLGVAGAVPPDGEDRPGEMGRGRQGRRRDDRLTKYRVALSSSSLCVWTRSQ